MGFILLLLKTKVPEHANARLLGSHQSDALQNITGEVSYLSNGSTTLGEPKTIGAFRLVDNPSSTNLRFTMQTTVTNSTSAYRSADFDASRVARTATETRAENVALAPRIIAF